jgi:SAM-dependent methyltransferase
MKEKNILLKEVEAYYSDKIKNHGISAKGVDWNSATSQELRFDILLEVLPKIESFSLLDYGCGYGALLEYLEKRYSSFDYLGFDISEEMLSRAKQYYSQKQSAKWQSALNEELFDYTIASGIFNVKQNQKDATWKEYVNDIIIDLSKKSKKGFAFNMLTSYSDKEYMKEYLFYGDPTYYFDFCKKNFSKYVSLVHDYPLYEFTIIVKKSYDS